MNEKGLAYPRTAWAYGERPVASAKLNAWDARIAAALELAYRLINTAMGGENGVIPGLEDMLRVEACTPPNLMVAVRPGYAFISGMPFRLHARAETAALTPPAGAPRIDVVLARLSDWSVFIQGGTEGAVPQAPIPPPGSLLLAELHLKPGMNTVRNADNGIDGFIIDRRSFTSAG